MWSHSAIASRDGHRTCCRIDSRHSDSAVEGVWDGMASREDGTAMTNCQRSLWSAVVVVAGGWRAGRVACSRWCNGCYPCWVVDKNVQGEVESAWANTGALGSPQCTRMGSVGRWWWVQVQRADEASASSVSPKHSRLLTGSERVVVGG